jgi:DNA-directed RNA polymerase subunit RPC12/RpoP
MLRVYLTNDSYPELRNLPLGWSRSRTWWKAIHHAMGTWRFWGFAATQALLLGIFVAADGLTVAVAGLRGFSGLAAHVGFGVLALGVFAYLQVSWGGDMMRAHLRAVSEHARYACPHCGQSLYAHIEAHGAETIRCPECGSVVERSVFAPPYQVPPACRAFPPW